MKSSRQPPDIHHFNAAARRSYIHAMETRAVSAHSGRFGPAFTLVVLAPLIAEFLPGATRTSSLFVFPLEMAIWGGGALLIRAAVRHFKLGWLNMFLMACALSIAEEFVIQQTSLAPMIIQITPGAPFGRAFGVNYEYFLWAVFYEAVLVVMVPVMVTELIFKDRRENTWLGPVGATIVGIVFLIACVPAWYLWTQVVREIVLKLPHYSPPIGWVAAGLATIALLVWLAIGSPRGAFRGTRVPVSPPSPWLLGVGASIAAVIAQALVVLAFGLRPEFPVWIAMAVGIAAAATGLYLLPRYAAHPAWSDSHRMGLALGAILGSMAIGFVGFIYGTSPLDLWGKIISNAIATVLILCLAMTVRARRLSAASSPRGA
jgi:hypothetical protein